MTRRERYARDSSAMSKVTYLFLKLEIGDRNFESTSPIFWHLGCMSLILSVPGKFWSHGAMPLDVAIFIPALWPAPQTW